MLLAFDGQVVELIHSIAKKHNCWKKPYQDKYVNGKFLLEVAGIKPGPHYKYILDEMLSMSISGINYNPEDMARELYREWMESRP